MINRVFLLGRITKVSSKKVGQDKKVATISLLTTKTVNGVERGTFHNVTVWNGQADFAEKLNNGAQIYVEGEIEKNTVEKDGNNKEYVNIVAQKIEVIDWNDSTEQKLGF